MTTHNVNDCLQLASCMRNMAFYLQDEYKTENVLSKHVKTLKQANITVSAAYAEHIDQARLELAEAIAEFEKFAATVRVKFNDTETNKLLKRRSPITTKIMREQFAKFFQEQKS